MNADHRFSSNDPSAIIKALTQRKWRMIRSVMTKKTQNEQDSTNSDSTINWTFTTVKRPSRANPDVREIGKVVFLFCPNNVNMMNSMMFHLGGKMCLRKNVVRVILMWLKNNHDSKVVLSSQLFHEFNDMLCDTPELKDRHACARVNSCWFKSNC
jgi:hypothetical protein